MAALKDEQQNAKPTTERIAKTIARSGLCSRRDAEILIGQRRVSVNGRIIESAALDVARTDEVLVDGKPLTPREPPRLWRYYKPKGQVTTHKDPQGRPTVFEALPGNLPRLISVGRLDFNTEGLLLLTNDGELARHLELPSTGWTRRYRVRAYGQIDQARLDELASGLAMGKVSYGPIEATLEREQGDNVWIALSIREGKNREVRRIMEHLALTVNRLIRVSFGPFMLGELKPGEIEEVKTSVLKDQLGPRLSRQLGVKREPVREERKLRPARGKPTYLRRKSPASSQSVKTVESPPPLKQRRIFALDGSEAAKVEFVPEAKPRSHRPFGRNAGDHRASRGKEAKRERDDRNSEVGRRRASSHGSHFRPGAGERGKEPELSRADRGRPSRKIPKFAGKAGYSKGLRPERRSEPGRVVTAPRSGTRRTSEQEPAERRPTRWREDRVERQRGEGRDSRDHQRSEKRPPGKSGPGKRSRPRDGFRGAAWPGRQRRATDRDVP